MQKAIVTLFASLILLVPLGTFAAPAVLNENRSWVTKTSLEFEHADVEDYKALNDLMTHFLTEAKLEKCEVAYVYPVTAGATLVLISNIRETTDYLSSVGKVFDLMDEELRRRHGLSKSGLSQHTKSPAKEYSGKPGLKRLGRRAWLIVGSAQLDSLDIGEYRFLNDSMFSLILEADFDHPLEGCVVPTKAGPTLVLTSSGGAVVEVPEESLNKVCELVVEKLLHRRNAYQR